MCSGESDGHCRRLFSSLQPPPQRIVGSLTLSGDVSLCTAEFRAEMAAAILDAAGLSSSGGSVVEVTCSGGSFVVDYVIVVPAGATATNGDVLPDGDAPADAFLADRRASINAAFATPEATSSFLAGRVSGIAADAVQVVDRAEVAAPVHWLPPCLNAGGTSTNGLAFTPEECQGFPKIPYCADDGVAAGCRLHCGFCTLPPGTEAQSPPAPSSPPLSPPAPPGESGILGGTVSVGVLIGAIAGSIGGCLLLTLCIVLVVVCCCCRKGKDGKRRNTLGTQARHQQYAVDVNGEMAVY